MSIWKIQRVLATFVAKESSCQWLDILPRKFILIKSFESNFSYIEVLFIDQNSKPVKMKDKINITLVFN